jgi:HEAT repeat protein
VEQRLYELLRQSTIRIAVGSGHGTGFFVAPGLILTCAHVIKAAQPGTTAIELYWDGQTHATHVTAHRDDLDLALLQVNISDHPCVYLHEEEVALREPLCSYGYPDTYPDGDTLTCDFEGWTVDIQRLLKFRMGQVRPGMSGAPLLRMGTGYVCGIIKRSRDVGSDLGGRAIPAATILLAFPELAAQQREFHRRDRRWVNCFWETVARTKYLEGLIRRYSSVTLPIGPAEGFSLQAIFQPLALRRDPLEEELLERVRQMAQSEEPVRDVRSIAPPVVAENGDDALKRTPKGRAVVLGGPGTGKTTTLRYLTEDRAQKALDDMTAPIPLFISLPYLARSGKLRRYVEDLVEDMDVDSRYADVLWKGIEAGNAFICMDGLDEVEPKHRPRMIELINNRASSAGNTWVIGSRFTEYKGGQFKQAQFAEWELLPMNHALRMELAQRLLPELQRLLPLVQQGTPLSAASFVTVLEQHPQASTWGDNPLLFSLAAVVFLQTRGLPSSRATLYQRVIGAVIETHEQDSMQRKLLLRQLSHFACWLHLSKGRDFSSDDLLAFFIDVEHKHEEEAAGLSYRIVSSGIMDVVGRETYCFRHQSFQEHLTALELARRLTSQNPDVQKNAWNVAWSKRTYSRWTEVLRLMMGALVQLGPSGRSQAQRWLHSLMQQRETEDGDPGNLGLMLALRSLVEVAELPEWHAPQTARLGEQIVSTCIMEALDHAPHDRGHTPEQLEASTQEMGYLPGALSHMVIEQCLTLLLGPDDGSRKVGAEILKKQRERVPVEPLLNALGNERAEIREAALDVLAEQGERVPLGRLLEAVHDDSWLVREAAAKALLKQGLRVPLEPLLQLLSERRSPLPSNLADVFKMYGERLPLEPFLNCLVNNDDDDKHRAVLARDVLIDQGTHVPAESWIEVIRRAGWTSHMQISFTLRSLKELIPVDALLDLLHDENEVARWVAAEALRDREPPAPVEKLVPALKNEDPRVRIYILEALSKQWQQVPEDPLWDALDDTRSMLVGAAIAVLGNRLSQETIASMLESEFEAIRSGALKALATHGTEANVELVLSALRDRSWQVRRQAIETIGALVAQGVFVPPEWLPTVLNDSDIMVSGTLERELEAIGGYLPVEVLFETLREGTSMITNRAASILKSQSERLSTRTLLDMMQQDYPGLRCAALHILEALGRKCPVGILLASLQDKYASVRRVAVEVLGRQSRLPNEQLLVALRDENTGVRWAAAQALQSLGTRAPLEGVLAALDDADKGICLIAATMCRKHRMSLPTEVIITALRNAKDDLALEQNALQIALLEVLARNEGQEALDTLLNILKYHSEDTVRHTAARALRRRWGPLSMYELQQMFDKLFAGEAPERRAAVELLGIYGEEGGLPVSLEMFLSAIQDDEDEDVRLAALQALLAQGERVPMFIYRDLLQVENPYVRGIAVKALAKQGTRLPLNDLLEALRGNDLFMYDILAQVLEMQGERLPLELLIEASQHSFKEVSRAAMRVLKAQKARIPVQSLLALLQDKQLGVRIAVMEVLTAYREPMPVEFLLQALYEPVFFREEEEYHIIAQALIAQGERVPIGSLLQGLYEGDRNVRRTVLEVLLGLKKPVPLEMLLIAVSDEDTGLIGNAALRLHTPFLASGESSNSIPVVGKAAQLLYNLYPDVMKQIAAEAIAILQGQSQGPFLGSITQCFVASVIYQLGYPAPEFLAKLTELLRWPHWLVRLNAIWALGKLRRNVPDEAIRRLLQLRRDPVPMMSAIRQAADNALAEILSLETGIEDD